jgi:hypothetical protein
MKWMVPILVAGISTGAMAEGMGRVEVRPDGNGGAEVTAGVDVLALRRNSAIQDAAWYAKPFVATKEIAVSTVETVKRNPGKTVFGVAVGYVAVRAVQGKLLDDVNRLTGKGSTGGNSSNSSDSLDGKIDASVNVSGDNNTVMQTINITSTRTPPPVFVTSKD